MRSVVLPLTIISSIALAALFGWTKVFMEDINQYNPPSYSDMECTFNPDNSNITYNLGPIAAMGQISAPDQDDAEITYYFQICANLTINHYCSDYDPGIGCAQQWVDGQCVYWLAEWDNNDAQISFANYSNPSSGMTIEFDNGEICYSEHGVTYPYKSRFIFLCDNSTDLKVLPGHQNSHDKCLYEFTLLSRYACVANHGECIWKSSDGNHMLDMSSIIGQPLSIHDANTTHSYYMYTPCRNAWRCDNDTYAMAYIFNDTSNECIKYLAVYEDGINEPNYNEELKTWQFVFTNGERCGGFENVFTVEWVCDKAAMESFVIKAVEMSTCNYLLVVNSTLACN